MLLTTPSSGLCFLTEMTNVTHSHFKSHLCPDCSLLLYIWNLSKIGQPQYIVVGFSSKSGTSVLIRSIYHRAKIAVDSIDFSNESQVNPDYRYPHSDDPKSFRSSMQITIPYLGFDLSGDMLRNHSYLKFYDFADT